jgi:hypothetical protein
MALVMTKQMLGLAAVAASVAGLGAMASTANAQTANAEVVVFGTDPCPRATDDEILICRRLPEAMRFRLPEAYRPSGTFQQRQSWATKSRQMMNVGSTGTGSCSAVGPGGHTGCLTQEIATSRSQAADAEAESTAPEQ